MITFFLIVATLVFAGLACLLGFYAYSALTDKSPDNFGILSFIGLVMGGLCIVASVLTACGVAAIVVQVRQAEPGPADCYCITLEDSLAEHYFTNADELIAEGRVKVNGGYPIRPSQEVCEGDVVQVTLKHPPIKPDGTPADDKRYWTVTRPGVAP